MLIISFYQKPDTISIIIYSITDLPLQINKKETFILLLENNVFCEFVFNHRDVCFLVHAIITHMRLKS